MTKKQIEAELDYLSDCLMIGAKIQICKYMLNCGRIDIDNVSRPDEVHQMTVLPLNKRNLKLVERFVDTINTRGYKVLGSWNGADGHIKTAKTNKAKKGGIV